MFSQVVIDKVLAHRGLTTLDVLIVVLGHRIGARGAEGMPMERVVAAARTAGAHDFIAEMAQGYDTAGCELGDRQGCRALCRRGPSRMVSRCPAV